MKMMKRFQKRTSRQNADSELRKKKKKTNLQPMFCKLPG
jgi:hypothetical protein